MQTTMKDIRSAPAGEYNEKLAAALKESGDFEKPVWVDLVKSGPGKMRPHTDPDFWFKRAASVLRQMYIHKIVGVNRLRSRYGSRKNRGMQPARFYKSSGKMLRVILQKAEAAGMVEKMKGKRSGRQLTSKGRQFLEMYI